MKDFSFFNERRKKSMIIVIIGFIAIIIGFVLLWILESPIGFVFFGGGVVTIITSYINFKKLSYAFKNVYVKDLIDKFFEKAEYFPDKGVTPEKVYRCNFLKRADRFHSEDLIVGKVGEVDFHTSDLKLEERHVRHTKNGTQVYYVTYFLGRFFEFDFPKEFAGQVIVSENRLFTFGKGLKKIELESVDFNKKFQTYTTNEHNAYYILTPHIMESIIDLEKRHPGSISMSFTGNTFNLAINNSKNTFELNLFRKIDERTIDEMKRDLSMILEIVNELKLNRNIFKY